MEGVGLAIPVTCALAAALQSTSAGMTATISGNLMVDLLLEQRTPADRHGENIRHGVLSIW